MSINVNTSVVTALETGFRGGIGELSSACIDMQNANFVGSFGTFFQMDYNQGSYGEWKATPFGKDDIICVTTDFTNIYMGGEGGFAIYDIQNETFGSLISLPNNWNCTAIAVSGGTLYLGSGSDLYLYNISAGTFSTIENPTGGATIKAITVIDGSLYLIAGDNKIYEYNGSNFVESYSIGADGEPVSIFSDTTNIYVAKNHSSETVVFDTTTKTVSYLQTAGGATCVFVDGTTLYAGKGRNVYTYDLQTMTSLGTISLTNATDNESLVTMTGASGTIFMVTNLAVHIYVVAMSDFYGTFPIPFGSVVSGDGDIYSIDQENNTLYAGGSFGYLEKINIQSGTSTLTLLSGDNGVGDANADLLSVAYNKDVGKVVVGSSTQAKGIVATTLTMDLASFFGNGSTVEAIAKVGSYAYFATNGIGFAPTIYKLNLTQPIVAGSNPSSISNQAFSVGVEIKCSCVTDNVVFFGADNGYIAKVDTTNDSVSVVSTGISSEIHALTGTNGVVYIGTSGGNFYTYNISSDTVSAEIVSPFTGAIEALATDGESVFVGGDGLEFAVYSITNGTFGNLIDVNVFDFAQSEVPSISINSLVCTQDAVYGAGDRGVLFSFGFIDTITAGRYNNFVSEWKDGNTYTIEETQKNNYDVDGVLPYGVADSVFHEAGYRFTAKVARSSITSSSQLPSGTIAQVTDLNNPTQYISYTASDFQSDGSFIVQVAPNSTTISTPLEVKIAWRTDALEPQDTDFTTYTFDLSGLSFAEIPVDTIVAGTYNDSTGEWTDVATYSIFKIGNNYVATGTVPYEGASVLFPTAGYRLAIKINRSTITNRNELPSGNILMITDTDGEGIYKYYDRSVFENDGSMIIVFAPTETTLDILREVKIAWTTWGTTPIASDYTTYTLDFSGVTLAPLPTDLVADVTVGYPITPRITSDKIVKVLVPEGGLYAGQFVNCVSLAPAVAGVSNNLEVYTATLPTSGTLGSKFIALVINGGFETLEDGRRIKGQPDYTRYKYLAGDVAPAILVDKNICFEVGSAVIKNGDALNIKNDIGKYIVPTNNSYNGAVANSPTQGNCLKIVETHDFPVGGKSGAGFVPTYVCRAE